MIAPRVLILSDSPLIAEVLQSRASARFPGACCQHVSSTKMAAEFLATQAMDIFVLQLELFEGDGLDLLRQRRSCRMRTLVISGSAAPRVALSLRALGVEAVHDFRRESFAKLDDAFDALACGRRHWSTSFGECLFGDEARRIRYQLAPREQLTFALLATGLGEKLLAEHLGMALSSVRSLVRDLHTKLNLHDRRDVEQAGARLGYTRYGSDGLRPFGLSVLIEEYRAQSRRPAPLPAALLAACGLSLKSDMGLNTYSLPEKPPDHSPSFAGQSKLHPPR